MAQYIDKDALVAWAKETYLCENASMIRKVCYKQLLEHLNTLEVKEVDLDESTRHYLLHEHISPLNEVLHQADLKVEMQYHKDIENAFKAVFELGLKVAQKGE
jgi:hypothetical protein